MAIKAKTVWARNGIKEGTIEEEEEIGLLQESHISREKNKSRRAKSRRPRRKGKQGSGG